MRRKLSYFATKELSVHIPAVSEADRRRYEGGIKSAVTRKMPTRNQISGYSQNANDRCSSYSGNYFYEWYKLSAGQLVSLECFGDASVSLFGMASFHQSGYVREAAIKRLDQITSGAELPFLILDLDALDAQNRSLVDH